MAINQHQRDTVLSLLTQCKSLKEACRAADIQDSSSILFLVESDEQFASQYIRAREIGYSLLADDLLSVSDDQNLDANSRRIMVDTRKWMLSKMLPKIYGDRLNLEHSGKVNTETMTEAELTAIAAKGRGG